jgi:hypothetical protein
MRTNRTVWASAAAALFVAGAVSAQENQAPKTDDKAAEAAKIKCVGANSCSAKSACATEGANSCEGKNACDAKGFLMLSKEECEKALAEKAKATPETEKKG